MEYEGTSASSKSAVEKLEEGRELGRLRSKTEWPREVGCRKALQTSSTSIADRIQFPRLTRFGIAKARCSCFQMKTGVWVVVRRETGVSSPSGNVYPSIGLFPD
jgi:hypothetical protein